MSSKFVLQQEDGTVANGDARGEYAVDLQTVRSSADQVASGIRSAILFGENNKASGTNSMAGGFNNTASNQRSVAFGYANTSSGQNSFVGSGYGNNASGTHSAAFGHTNNVSAYIGFAFGQGNSVSSDYSVVSGGQANTASTNTHATVVGGSANTASGQYSVAGGWLSVASGNYSVVLGRENIGSAAYSYIIGRANATNVGGVVLGTYNTNNAGESSILGNACSNTSAAQYSTTLGGQSVSYLRGQFTNSSGNISNAGDAQQSTLVSRKQDTLSSAATTVLSLDGTGTTNLIIPKGNYRVWNVTVKWVAVITADGGAAGITYGDTIASTDQLLFKRVGGFSSVVGTASTLSTHSDASMASCSMAYTAGASQELALTFTGPTFASGGPVTCRIVAKVELTEVAW